MDYSDIYVDGGEGNEGYGAHGTTDGAGGNGTMTVGSNLTMTGVNGASFLQVEGEDGSYDYRYGGANSGAGGNATLSVAGAVSMDNSEIKVYGYDGGDSYGGNGGNGGKATMTVGSNLTLTSVNGESSLYVEGGEAGYNDEDYNGLSGKGGDATLSVGGAVSMDSSEIEVIGGEGNEGYGLAGQTEPNGGNGTMTVGSNLTLTSNNGPYSYLEVEGSESSYDYGYIGTNGGNGGNGILNVAGAVSMDSSEIDVYGGEGGYSESANGGNGGNATLNIGSNLTMTGNNRYSELNIEAGEGGENSDDYGFGVSGKGGDATLNVAGAVSMDNADIYIYSGEGNEGYGLAGQTNGAGGNATMTVGSNLTLTDYEDSSYLELDAYDGGYDYNYGNGGAGGNATLTVGKAVSMDSSEIDLYGGSGGSADGGNGGNGGNATMTVGSNLSLTNIYEDGASSIYIEAGDGGYNDYDELGISGKGGDATLNVAGAVSMDSGYIEIDGGSADYGYGAPGQTEAVGGNASFSAASLNMGNSNGIADQASTIYMSAGSGAWDGAGLAGGNGGNATLNISGGATLNNASAIEVYGGWGGGATAGVTGLAGTATANFGSLNLVDASSLVDVESVTQTGGSAYVNVGTLTGSGSITMYGQTNSLLTVSAGNFSGTLNGNETLLKTGSGALTLSGVNAYTGPTSITAGTLAVGGSAFIPGDAALTGGTLETFNGPGLLYVAGNYTQGPKGNLQLSLYGNNPGDLDILLVGGNASLKGNLTVGDGLAGLKPTLGSEYLAVVVGGTMTGKFDNLLSGFQGEKWLALYGSNSVTVEAEAFTFAGLNPTTSNGKSVAAALDALSAAGPSTLALEIQNLATEDPKLLGDLAPTVLTSGIQMGFFNAQATNLVIGQRLDALLGGDGFSWGSSTAWNHYGSNPMFAGDMPASDEAAIAKNAKAKEVEENGGWDGFLSGQGNFGTLSGDGNALGYNYSNGGMVGGADTRVAPGAMMGILLGYNQSIMTDANNSSVTMSGGQAGLYGGLRMEEFHIGAVLSGALNNYNSNRAVMGQMATGTFTGQQWSGQLSMGIDIPSGGGLQIGPYAMGQYTSVNIGSFTETGSAVNETIAPQGQSNLSSDLGVRAGTGFDCGGGFILTPSVNVAWMHQFQGNNPTMNAAFVAGGSTFAVTGPSTGTDGCSLGAGLNAQVMKGFNLYAQYQGVVGMTNFTSNDIAGGLTFGF